MLWAVSFVILFTIGGFSGLMLAITPADFQYQDTYFVVAHFHYVLVTGALFSIIAAIYYWWPKWTGKMYSDFWSKVHFWWTMVFVNVLFFPQHFLGLAGMPRRIPDYNVAFSDWNLISTIGAYGMFLTPFMMFGVLYWSLKHGKPAAAGVVGRRAWSGVDGAVARAVPHLRRCRRSSMTKTSRTETSLHECIDDASEVRSRRAPRRGAPHGADPGGPSRWRCSSASSCTWFCADMTLTPEQAARRFRKRAALVCVCMFLFGFACVPIYRIACDHGYLGPRTQNAPDRSVDPNSRESG